MKKLQIALLLSVFAGISMAKPAPDATNLHPEKYMLRFVLASGSGKMFTSEKGMSEFSTEIAQKEKWTTGKGNFSEAHKRSHLVSMLDEADATYSEISTFAVDMNEEFSFDKVSGTLLQEASGPTLSCEIQYENRPHKLKDLRLKTGEWSVIALGRADKADYILVKLYKPKK